MPLFEIINNSLNFLAPIAFSAVLGILLIVYIVSIIRRVSLLIGIYLAILAFAEAGFAFLAFYMFPRWFSRVIENPESEAVIRWFVLYLVIPLFWWYLTRKYSGLRGLYTILIILTIFLFGWQYQHWIGILFLSFPILLIFFVMLDRLAQVVLPAGNPNNLSAERWQKTTALIKYMAGIQYPVWLPRSKTDREIEMRILGSPFFKIGEPGVLWTWSHQVAAISTGIYFAGIVNPGTVFTNQYERPIALVDTRTQLRVTSTETVTKDGISIKTVIFVAFKIDDTMVKEALRRMGIVEALQQEVAGNLEFHWDEWVIRQVEDAARQAVAYRNLDQLWRPEKPGDSALDEMANSMSDLLRPKLFNAGVLLFTARIVNFDLNEEGEEDKKIIERQLETWRTNWQQKITQAKAEVTAIYREELEKAHAYAKSALLETIAESLQNARRINVKLPRHVIAQYYIHALDEYIKQQPGLNAEEIKERVKNLQHILLFSREGND